MAAPASPATRSHRNALKLVRRGARPDLLLLAHVFDRVDLADHLLEQTAVLQRDLGQIFVHHDVARLRIDHDRAARAVGLPAEERLERGVAVERGGQKAEDDRIKGIKLIIAGDKITLKTPNGDNESAYKLDASMKPRAIDIIPTDGTAKGRPRPGIYELDGDTFKLCYSLEPDKDRPKEFATKSGARQMFMILKRDK